MEMLHRCPSVKSLELEGWEGYDPENNAHCTSPNITSLVIRRSEYESYPEMVLLSFNLPSLTAIMLDGDDGCLIHWPTETLISLISKSSCIITTFTIRNFILSDLDLIAALQVMPSLLHLKIQDHKPEFKGYTSAITSNLISSLIQHESTSISLVPKLHTLHLVSRIHSGTFDDSAFVSMVGSRWFKPGSDRSAAMSMMGRGCIRSVVLKFEWREIDKEVYKPLQILDKEGLKVVVSGTNGIQV
jgi:hypothetical protein